MTGESTHRSSLTREEILAALSAVSDGLGDRGVTGRVGETRGLPTDRLNDGVKGFTSARPEVTAGNLPQFPHLRVTMPVPEYLLAMKCMAARIGSTSDEASDVDDKGLFEEGRV